MSTAHGGGRRFLCVRRGAVGGIPSRGTSSVLCPASSRRQATELVRTVSLLGIRRGTLVALFCCRRGSVRRVKRILGLSPKGIGMGLRHAHGGVCMLVGKGR